MVDPAATPHSQGPSPQHRSPGTLAQLACLAEVGAPKAGNVHPEARFVDCTWMDFAISAALIAPILNRAESAGVGATVLACVEATRRVVVSNTNLGMILLLAPLCAATRDTDLRRGVARVLATLDERDAHGVYAAIRTANPGGLGSSETADVHAPPQIALVEAMRLAAGRDAVARQYATGFALVFGSVAAKLSDNYDAGLPLDRAIALTHLQLMADEPDSLIRRKCGDAVAEESQRRAQRVVDAGWPRAAGSAELHADFDRWLRADGHRRNPGSTADLIAAGLFVVLWDGRVRLPWRWSDAASASCPPS